MTAAIASHDAVLESLDCHRTTAESHETAAILLDMARQRGADQAQVTLSVSQGISIEVRNQRIETLEFNRDRGAVVTLYVGARKGLASTTDLSPAGLAASVDAALAIAKYAAADPCAGLPHTGEYAELAGRADLDLFHPWHASVRQLVALAQDCERSGMECDPRISNSEGAVLNSHQGVSVLANSDGFAGVATGSRHSLSCSVICQDEQGMQRDYFYDTRRDPEQLMSANSIGVTAAERSVARLGARQPPQGRFPVLFQREVAAGLFGHLLAAISGGQLYRKASFLVDCLNQSLFPPAVSIHERPHVCGGLASRYFDAEGVATADKAIIDQGLLSSYLLSTYSARRLGMTSTGNAGGASNLLVAHGTHDWQALLAELGTGLVVTEVMGPGVNIVSGDYSRGASGFWVENGEIVYPVNEITIAGRLQDMFAGIVTIGADVDRRSSLETGSVLIKQMTIASQG